MENDFNDFTRRKFVKNAAAGIGAVGLAPGISRSALFNSSMRKNLMDSGMDAVGSAVGVVKLHAEKAYADIPLYLQKFINTNDRQAWETICEKIDYIYNSFGPLMMGLDKENGFLRQIGGEIENGKILFYKINTVVPVGIDPVTHGEGSSCTSCTDWAFVAALFRWFHDNREISYHDMALGEGGVLQGQLAVLYSRMLPHGKKVTQEAILEGKTGDFYGGWGFYFVRKYLSERHPDGHKDDPMKGFHESEEGIYVPPGRRDGLYVYALNCIDTGEGIRGREVSVADGDNYKNIMLHKAIIGGEPGNDEDMKNYPGCVLINLPKLKVHPLELLTNAIKNLGIGLYSTEAGWDRNPNNTDWRYGIPQKYPPTIKNVIHEYMLPEIDRNTGLTKFSPDKRYIVNRTGGIWATMVDINLALTGTGTSVFHIVDAIHAINIAHDTNMPGGRIPEGLMIAGKDPVAIDLFCARYMFHNVKQEELPEGQKYLDTNCEFMQKVPVPVHTDKGIVSNTGYDSPLSRFGLFKYAQKRGLGSTTYYVIGSDIRDNTRLVSRNGHFGKLVSGTFRELLTDALYYDFQKFYWDMNTTSRAFLRAADELNSRKMAGVFLDNLGMKEEKPVHYDNFGKRGWVTSRIILIADTLYLECEKDYGSFMGPFIFASRLHQYWRPEYNEKEYAVFEDFINSFIIHQAYTLSLMPEKKRDPLYPGIEFGAGSWPSFEYAEYEYLMSQLFGAGFPESVSLMSMYGFAFQYADKKYNNGGWSGKLPAQSAPDSIVRYWQSVRKGERELPFKIFLPEQFVKNIPASIPNIRRSQDASMLFTADFKDGAENWA